LKVSNCFNRARKLEYLAENTTTKEKDLKMMSGKELDELLWKIPEFCDKARAESDERAKAHSPTDWRMIKKRGGGSSTGLSIIGTWNHAFSGDSARILCTRK